MSGNLYANPNFIAADPRLYPDYTTAEYAAVDPVIGATFGTGVPFVGRIDAGATNAMPQSRLFDATGKNIGLESLAPQKLDITVGQIVPFFFVLDVKGQTNAATGVVTINATWDGFTRSAQDFGYDTTKGILAAFVDMREKGTVDKGAVAKVDQVVWNKVIDPQKGDYIDAQIQVSGLDKDDYIVVEVWVALDENLPAGKVNSVVQAQMESARTGPIGGTGTKINNGTQTIPLKTDDALPKVTDLFITKSDNQERQPEDAERGARPGSRGLSRRDGHLLHRGHEQVEGDGLRRQDHRRARSPHDLRLGGRHQHRSERRVRRDNGPRDLERGHARAGRDRAGAGHRQRPPHRGAWAGPGLQHPDRQHRARHDGDEGDQPRRQRQYRDHGGQGHATAGRAASRPLGREERQRHDVALPDR
jgi:hypothetical protein